MLEKKSQQKTKSNRILLIFVCVFASLAIVFGSVFGIIIMINEANALVKLDGVTMEEGVVRCFGAYYKSLHLAGLKRAGISEAEDSVSFWESEYAEGVTHGELYESSFKNYLAGIVASNRLFLDLSSFTSEDEEYLDTRLDSFISYYGSKDAFNEEAAALGFDYEDFAEAMKLSLRASLAMKTVYGYQGENLKAQSAESVAQCKEYLATYSRVKMVLLCNEKITYTDGDGEEVEHYLTEEEKAEREALAEEMREAIANKAAGLDGAVTETMFDYVMEKSDTDPLMMESGYYFNMSAEQTANFYYVHPALVDAAIDMEVGEYREISISVGTCFLYKCENESRAYKNEENPFFSDFYSDAATYLFQNSVEILASEATFSDKYYELDPLAIPESNRFFISNWN